MTKVSEMSIEAFRLAIAEQIADARNAALASGVTKESIDELVAATYSQSGNFQLAPATRKIRGAILKKIEAAGAETHAGVLIGSHDRVGKKSPIKYTLLKANKQHIEVSCFGSKATYRDQKIEIPCPAKVTIKATYDSQYDSWNLVSIEEYQMLDKTQVKKVLSQVAIPAATINKDMAYSKGQHAASPVVLHGKIGTISNEVVQHFVEKEDGSKEAVIDRYLPVMCQRELAQDAGDALPCFQFTFKSSERGSNFLRCDVTRMRKAQPTLLVTDIEEFCQAAVDKYPNDFQAQVDNLGEWLTELPCYIVGVVSTYKQTYDEDKQERNWVSIAITAIVDTEGDAEPGQKKISEEDKKPTPTPPRATTAAPPVSGPIVSSPPAAPAQESVVQKAAAKAAQQPAGPDFSQPAGNMTGAAANPVSDFVPVGSQQKPAAPAAPGPQKSLKYVSKQIKTWCTATGVNPSSLSIQMLKQKALDVIDNVPDAIVIEAIDLLKDLE